MKKFTSLMVVGAVLSMSAPALAQSRAVNVSIGSIGSALDSAALRTVRQVVGFAGRNPGMNYENNCRLLIPQAFRLFLVPFQIQSLSDQIFLFLQSIKTSNI